MMMKRQLVFKILSVLCLAPVWVGPIAMSSVQVLPAEAFFQSLQTLCGQRFEGRIVADEPPPAADDPFTGKRLLMFVQHCSDTEIRIPFSVGEDRSRTWIVTRIPEGLRLKHDHRHEDGTPDEITLYGGDTQQPGTVTRQSFPADQETLSLFKEKGLQPSLSNVWSLELVEGRFFVYELARPEGRLFRVRFDLTDPK
jgi:hypothetical protein